MIGAKEEIQLHFERPVPASAENRGCKVSVRKACMPLRAGNPKEAGQAAG